MKNLFQTICERKAELRKSPFLSFLADENNSLESRASFIPHMVFFSMGFKDLLQFVYDENSDDPVQQDVNVHVGEDNTHWVWYLRDLEELDLPNNFMINPKDNYERFAEIYNDNTFAIRDVVYQAMYYAKLIEFSPRLKMALMEVFESTFAAFIESFVHVVHELDKFDTLHYFGKGHLAAEAEHAAGNWIDGAKESLPFEDEMNEQERYLGYTLINGMYDKFEAMFETWNNIQKEVQAKEAVTFA